MNAPQAHRSLLQQRPAGVPTSVSDQPAAVDVAEEGDPHHRREVQAHRHIVAGRAAWSRTSAGHGARVAVWVRAQHSSKSLWRPRRPDTPLLRAGR